MAIEKKSREEVEAWLHMVCFTHPFLRVSALFLEL